MVCSLVSQLYRKREDARQPLDSLFSSYGNGSRALPMESLCQCILLMMQQIDEVWIIVDAFDECITRDGAWTQGLLSWMKELRNSMLTNVHLLVTSRPEDDIRFAIGKYADADEMIRTQPLKILPVVSARTFKQ